MYKSWTISTLLLAFIFASSWGQERYDFSTDTLTYNQYLRADWKALSQSVQSANKRGISFYYLALRGGFAAFYTGNYNQSVEYFELANRQNPPDDVEKEYYYLATLYAGKRIASIKAYNNLPKTVQVRYADPNPKIIESISLESGYSMNNDYNTLFAQAFDGGFGIYSERILMKDITHYSVGVTHSLSPATTINQSFTQIKLNKEQQYYALQLTPYDTLQPIYAKNTKQYQYHINANFNINDHFFISPAFTQIGFITDTFNVLFDDFGTYHFSNAKQKDNEQVFSLTMGANFNKMYLAFNTNYLHKKYFSRWQGGIDYTIFPLQKKVLYLTLGIQIQSNTLNNNTLKDNTVETVKLGGYYKNLWIEASYSTGNLLNYVESNGYIVYNTSEQLTSKTGLSLSMPLYKKHLWLSVYYKYLRYNTSYSYYKDQLPLQNTNFTQNTHSLATGLIWHF